MLLASAFVVAFGIIFAAFLVSQAVVRLAQGQETVADRLDAIAVSISVRSLPPAPTPDPSAPREPASAGWRRT